MKLRKNLLRRSRLYLILDKAVISSVSCSKIGIIQLRDKVSDKAFILSSAIKLARRLSKTKTLFIVNDYIDIAILSGSDGVHLGQGDLPLKAARSLIGKDKIIGISCHNLRQALKAQREGADYIGIGPIYKTATKLGVKPIGLIALRQLKGKIKIPYFAIGNIHGGNINEILATGARRIAVCRAILKDNNPSRAASKLFDKLK